MQCHKANRSGQKAIAERRHRLVHATRRTVALLQTLLTRWETAVGRLVPTPHQVVGNESEDPAMPGAKKVFVKTFGCQMNVYDSERMSEALKSYGYSETDTAEEADLVILNTCHIREKAAEKV
jgi:hypothetical protein